jgi:hypothetical protein
MVNHAPLVAGTGSLKLVGRPVVVTRTNQLPEALRGNVPIIIDNAEMERRFRSMQAWRDVRFIGVLVAGQPGYHRS